MSEITECCKLAYQRGKKSKEDYDDKKLRLLLRSVYLKGHQDSLTKTSDMDWEEPIVNQIRVVFGLKARKFVLLKSNQPH